MEFKKTKPNIANFCWRWISILLMLSMAFSLSSCGKSIGETAITGSSKSVVYGASEFAGSPYSYQVCESGILYLSGRLAYYYDFEAKQSYVLCNRANCRHNDTSCPAYASDDEALTGLAYFQDAVYMIRRNDDAAQFELIRYDLASNAQKVVAALEIGSYEAGEWVIQSVANVVYAGNYAWMEVTYGYVALDETSYGGIEAQSTVLTGIDVTTGEITQLNEVTDRNDMIGYKKISADYVVFEKLWYREPMLSQSEFFAALEQGEYSEYADKDDAYYSYQSNYMATVPELYADVIYEIATGSMTEFDSGECIKEFNTDGSLNLACSPYVFDGIDGDVLLYCFLFEDSYTMYSYSIFDGTRKELFTLPNGGGCLVTNNNYSTSNSFVDEHLMLCCEYTEDSQAQIFYYDLETSTRTDLFIDAENITFRMVGYTEDRYIGLMYQEILGNMVSSMYQISKEDYEAGNLDASKKIPINTL